MQIPKRLIQKIPSNFTSLPTFAKSSVDDVITKSNLDYVLSAKSNIDIYDSLYEQLHLFLSKLPNHLAKKYVSNLLDKRIVLLSSAVKGVEGLFSRVVVSGDKLSAICLDMKDLDIRIISRTATSDFMLDRVRNPDEVIYAAYYGFVRSAVMLNKNNIRSDKKLHALVNQFFNNLIIGTFNKQDIISAKQKYFIKLVISYIFFKYFLKERHDMIKGKILREMFAKENPEYYDEFSEMFDKLKPYDGVKDIPKCLIDTNVMSTINPNEFIVKLLKRYGSYGFYNVIGSLDMLIGLSITSKYPFELFERVGTINKSLQDDIETHMDNYMKRVTYQPF